MDATEQDQETRAHADASSRWRIELPRKPPGTSTSPIEHVILIMKENRSFDHYFGTFPGANGATTGETSDGETIELSPCQRIAGQIARLDRDAAFAARRRRRPDLEPSA